MSPRGSVLFGALLAALVSGCAHAPGYPPDPIQRPDAVADFATLYSQNCAACHGANGQNGPAIDLANPEYQALVDDATLRKWISGGMPGTEMPAFAAIAGRNADRRAGECSHRRNAPAVVAAECASRSDAAFIRADTIRRFASRRACLSGALRVMPLALAPANHQPRLSLPHQRSGLARHHRRRTTGHRPARLAQRRAGRSKSYTALRRRRRRHRRISGEPADCFAAVGRQPCARIGREANKMSNEDNSIERAAVAKRDRARRR